MISRFHKAFTLMEVNLAILVMAGCVLSVVTLYSLGFRENKQSMEDVASAAYADAVMGKMVSALSDPNITWADFKSVVNVHREQDDLISTNPRNGWGDYFDANTGEPLSGGVASSLAKRVFSDTLRIASKSGIDSSMPDVPSGSIGSVGLVVRLKVDGEVVLPVIQIGFRASKNAATLMSSPMYYTEVAFQGRPESESEEAGR